MRLTDLDDKVVGQSGFEPLPPSPVLQKTEDFYQEHPNGPLPVPTPSSLPSKRAGDQTPVGAASC